MIQAFRSFICIFVSIYNTPTEMILTEMITAIPRNVFIFQIPPSNAPLYPASYEKTDNLSHLKRSHSVSGCSGTLCHRLKT